MAEICFTSGELPRCWYTFCVYSRKNFKTRKEILEYLDRFGAVWRPYIGSEDTEDLTGWYLKFTSEEGYGMFLLRWS